MRFPPRRLVAFPRGSSDHTSRTLRALSSSAASRACNFRSRVSYADNLQRYSHICSSRLLIPVDYYTLSWRITRFSNAVSSVFHACVICVLLDLIQGESLADLLYGYPLSIFELIDQFTIDICMHYLLYLCKISAPKIISFIDLLFE